MYKPTGRIQTKYTLKKQTSRFLYIHDTDKREKETQKELMKETETELHTLYI